jgi:hypothetical protein
MNLDFNELVFLIVVLTGAGAFAFNLVASYSERFKSRFPMFRFWSLSPVGYGIYVAAIIGLAAWLLLKELG